MQSVVVLIMEGCPACHEYMPRFARQAAPLRAQGMPISIYDLNKHPGARALADKLKVEATPTTVVIGKKGPQIVARGAVDDAEISRILQKAAQTA